MFFSCKQRRRNLVAQLLKKACLYDNGNKIIKVCLPKFLPLLQEHIKIVAQKLGTNFFIVYAYKKTLCIVCFWQEL